MVTYCQVWGHQPRPFLTLQPRVSLSPLPDLTGRCLLVLSQGMLYCNMSSKAEKTRFSARVLTGTLDTMDGFAESENLTRSQAIDRIVDEWQEEQQAEESDQDGRGGEKFLDRFVGYSLSLAAFIGGVLLALGIAMWFGTAPGEIVFPLAELLGFLAVWLVTVAMLAREARDMRESAVWFDVRRVVPFVRGVLNG